MHRVASVRSWLRRIARRLGRTRFEWLTIRTIVLDLRYGGYCGGIRSSRFAHLGAAGTMSTEYHHLDELFRRAGIRVDPADVLVDIGCGKGRVINYWLARGYRNRIIGLELDAGVADRVRRRTKVWANVAVITGDAVENLPEDGTVFYAFNPFDAAVMSRLKSRMEALSPGERDVVLLYHNCYHKGMFENDPAWRVESLGEVGPLPAALITLTKRPSTDPPAVADPSTKESTRQAVTSVQDPRHP
jgi:SAM-dependent methyltransferase